ncbi:MAG: chemotaxis protein CheW [Fusobacteriota bacterium]
MKSEETTQRLIIFNLGENIYGFDIQKVQEIMNVPVITKLPSNLDYILGVINLRGKVIPIINLRKRLRLKNKQKSEKKKIIILKENDSTYGFLVDGISEVEKINSNMIESAPDNFSKSEKEYIKNIVKMEDSILILLKINKIIQ